MRLRYYLIRRILLQILIVVGVLTLSFVVTKSLPQDPIATLLGPQGMRDPGLVREVTIQWKLDQPLWVQYLFYLQNMLTGNWGQSLWTRGLVINDLANRFPATLELSMFGFLIAMTIAIPTGIISAVYRDRWVDHLSRVLSVAGISAPGFWWGVIFLYVFYYLLGIFPGGGRLSSWMAPPPHVTGLYLIDSLLVNRPDTFWNCYGICSYRHSLWA